VFQTFLIIAIAELEVVLFFTVSSLAAAATMNFSCVPGCYHHFYISSSVAKKSSQLLQQQKKYVAYSMEQAQRVYGMRFQLADEVEEHAHKSILIPPV
jgi:hypothetical protein